MGPTGPGPGGSGRSAAGVSGRWRPGLIPPRSRWRRRSCSGGARRSTPDINDAFARTGTTHLLAISGLHLQALAWVLAIVARWLGVRRQPTFLLVALGTVAYAALVGFAPSVVRSAAMTVGACLAGWRRRCSTPGNLLAGALLATLVWNPNDLFDVGCQLSFLAVAAVIWLVPEVLSWQAPQLLPLDVLERQTESWWRIRRRVGLAYLRAGVVGSAVVWVAAWPLVALRFHLVSPVAILANIPLIPLTSAALLLAGVTLTLAAVWPPLGIPIAWLCGQTLRGTEVLVRWGMDLPAGHSFVPGPPPALVVVFYLLLATATVAVASGWPPRRVRFTLRGAALCGLTLAIWSMIPIRPEVPTADVCAVGHGLAIAVRSPSGQTALYDAGKLGDPHVGRRVIAPALWTSGVRRVDVLILSHADADHFNGVPDLLDRFAIGAVRIPPGFADPTNPGAARLVAAIKARDIPVASIAAGDVIDLGAGVTLTARLPAPDDQAGSDNARSVVLDVTQHGQTLLLTGDLEGPGLTNLIGQPAPDPPLNALVAPHHGGRTSNPRTLYDWARAEIVAVSQRSPAANTRDPLAFLESSDTPSRLLRTWKAGAIRFRWTPPGLTATTFLDPAPTPQPAPPPAPRLAGFGVGLPGVPTWLVALAGLLGGAGLALAVITVEWGAWALVAPGRRREEPGSATVPPARLARRITHQAQDGAVLVGDWFAPDLVSGSDRLIVLLHGLAEDRRAFEIRVGRLLAGGWNVAAVDARGSGESGGAWVSFGGREADDLRGWIDTLTPLIPNSPRFAVWGRSMGAATALRGASLDGRISALVLEAPYDDLRTAVAGVLRKLRVPGQLAPLVLARARWLAGVALDRPHPLDLAPQIQAATLVVHGSADAVVPVDLARNLAHRIGRDHARTAEFLEVPGAGHANVFAIGGDPLADAVVAFLDRAIPPG